MRNRTVAFELASVVCLAFVLVRCAHGLERVSLHVAGKEITVEVARTDSEREHGLMGRTRLGPAEGMLFIFDRDQHLEFWMKETPLPLSIAFLSEEGKILEIRDMQPFDLRTIRSRYYARYALEMNQGAFEKLGIAAGDFVTFPKDISR